MNITASRFAIHLRTWLLVAALSALLIAVGATIGGGALYIFVLLTAAMNLIGYWFSDRIALATNRAQPLGPEEAPWLRRMVEDLAERAELPMPRIYVVASQQPNAFATGRNPNHSAIAVTEGLLEFLPADQIRAVLAHEFAHIKNRDILISSIGAMIAGAISAIASILQFSLLFGGANEEEDSPLAFVGTLLAVIVAPLAAMLLQLGISRQREYMADATGARLLGRASPLADALENLERGSQTIPMQVNPAQAALYAVHPLPRKGLAGLFLTHPPIAERVRRLRAIDRERAFALAA